MRILQSGESSPAKHGGAHFSAVYGSIKDPIAAPEAKVTNLTIHINGNHGDEVINKVGAGTMPKKPKLLGDHTVLEQSDL